MVIEEGYVFVNSSEEDSIIEEDELENEIPMKENNPEDDR